MENFKIATVLMVLILVGADGDVSTEELSDKCFPDTKMCLIDAESCFAEEGLLKDTIDPLATGCAIWHAEVRPIYKKRNFSIWIHRMDLKDFPQEVTYSVYTAKRNGNGSIWGGPLKVIKECCDMTLSKSCFLPEYDEEQILVIILPRRTDRVDEPWYCANEISEESGLWDSCEVIKCDDCVKDESKKCLNFTDEGFVYLQSAGFVPLSPIKEAAPSDYCFFAAPDKISNLFTRNRVNKFSRSEHFSTMDMEKDCEMVVGETDAPRNTYEAVGRDTDVSLEGVVCFHLRVLELNSIQWQNHVHCFAGEKATVYRETRKKKMVSFSTVVGVTACVVAAVMLMMGYCFRRYVIKKIEKRLEKVLPATFIVAKTTYFNDKTLQDESSSNEESFPIEVYFPIEGLSDDNEDVSFKLDSIEKNQIWASKEVQVSIAEEGIYCKKLDMHSYVKMKHELDNA